MARNPSFSDPNVAAVFKSYPKPVRDELLKLRQLIFSVAAASDDVGELQETLKWGQPAYLTSKPKSGSTLRLGLPKDGGFAVYAHCRTSIISEFRNLFPDEFTYEGNRAIHFVAGEPLPLDLLEILVHRALTYHVKAGK